MEKSKPESLYQNLKRNRFKFIDPGGYHLGTIRRKVKERYPDLCDDNELCTHESPTRPEWDHKVRLALDSLKRKGDISYLPPETGTKNGYWIVGGDKIKSKVSIYIDVVKEEEEYFEGEKHERHSVFYERDHRLREAAINYHGTTCMACGFNFGHAYGDYGAGFIEIHHLKPVSTLSRKTKVSPQSDMIVLCSNCHRMVHLKRAEVLSLPELKKLIKLMPYPKIKTSIKSQIKGD